MMNQNNSSNSYRTTQYRTTNNDLQLKTYGGLFEEMNLNLVEGNHVFTDELYTNESTLEGFIQTSHYSSSNFQHFPADEDYYCSFFQDDHGQLEFAQNLAGSCLDVDNNIITSMSGAHSAVIAGRSMNQNVALKELDDLLNNTEEDPMVYCCYDGEMNSFDIDQYSEWLNAWLQELGMMELKYIQMLSFEQKTHHLQHYSLLFVWNWKFVTNVQILSFLVQESCETFVLSCNHHGICGFVDLL